MKMPTIAVIGLTTVAVGTGVGITLQAIKNDADRLEVYLTPEIRGVAPSGFIVQIAVKIKNPTNRDFRFSQPFVRLLYNGRQIGSSQAFNSYETYNAGQEKNLSEPVRITIPYSELLFLGWSLIQDLTSGKQGIQVEAEVSTTTKIFYVFSHEYKKVYSIMLRKEQQP